MNVQVKKASETTKIRYCSFEAAVSKTPGSNIMNYLSVVCNLKTRFRDTDT